jgi:formamidopyrimidine-DNA glycosylase
MPELPDLEYLVARLAPRICGRTIAAVETGDPVVLRKMLPGTFQEILVGRKIESLTRHGPFLRFLLDEHEIVMHCMLTGRLKIAPSNEKPVQYRRLTLGLDDGMKLHYGDEKNMGKIYICDAAHHPNIPLFNEQGVDVIGNDFTFDLFSQLLGKNRRQARVFIMDQTVLSAIGNAYADEILYSAGIHPKTPCNLLGAEDRRRLYDSIRAVLSWGIAEIEKADRPIEEKVRAHMRVRNRGREPCSVCGTTIRREQVYGYDTFYCPHCQRDRTGKSLPWEKLGGPPEHLQTHAIRTSSDNPRVPLSQDPPEE